MEKHLKDKSYYENLYERKMIQNQKKYYDEFQNSDNETEKRALNFVGYMTKMGDYSNRSKTIEKWMEEDIKKDEFYENTNSPRDILRCKLCNNIMELESKEFWDGIGDKPDKILFIYRCNECRKGRAIYNTGEEFEITKHYCKKCSELIDYTAKFEGDILITKFSCESCGEKYTEKENFSSNYKEEKITEKNIDLHGYKDKEALEMSDAYDSINRLKDLTDSLKKKDDDKIYKDKIDELKKYNFFQLEEYINKELEKTNFKNFKIINKEQVKTYMKCEFEVYATGNFGEKTNKKFDKFLSSILSNSNWKIQDNKTYEKLGLLNGIIFGYDIESDLIELVKKRMK